MRTLSIGSISIDRVVENERFVFERHWLFRDLAEEVVVRHRHELGSQLIDFKTNGLILSFHSFLIRTPHHNILVDTCNGSQKHRPGVPWQHLLAGRAYIENLGALGVQPADVDMVLCTHLHGDHVGWNTQLINGRWVPTFPNATYLMSREDYQHFTHLPPGPDGQPAIHPSLADSIAPVVDAGQAQLVEIGSLGRYELTDGVWIEAAPGHTPGHVLMHVEAGGAQALLSGDIIHHPIQFLEPELVNCGDVDALVARRTRERVIEAALASDALLLTGHFPAPTAGRVVCTVGGNRFTFVD